jgi:hypothetical protein
MTDELYDDFNRTELIEIIEELKTRILDLQQYIAELNYEQLEKNVEIKPIKHEGSNRKEK